MIGGPGWIFYGVFLACGVIVVAYVVWMLWEERR